MKPRTFFICGCPKSGTTITQAVLNSHPQVGITNENSWIHIWYEFYRKIIPRSHNGGESFSFHQYEIELMLELIDKHSKEIFYDYYKIYNPNAKIVGDKLPGYLILIDWIRERFPDAKFIICKRNERDNINSMMRNIVMYKNDKKRAMNNYKGYEVMLNRNKDKPDCHIMDLDELHKGKATEIFNGIAEFLDIDPIFQLDVVNGRPEVLENTGKEVAERSKSSHEEERGVNYDNESASKAEKES